MATKPIKIEMSLDDKDVEKKVKSINTELGKTESAMEEVESAGKTMARAIEAAADDMIDEIDRTKLAVDAMERAFDGADFDAKTVVAELKKVGLSCEDIEADAEELARALQKTGDVRVHAKAQGFDDLDQALGTTTDGGKATSAAIGGIGGSISELPGIGALGPIAESVGQLSEGALEGEVNLKQLLGAGLALGAVALVAQGIQGHFAKIAASKAFRKEQIEDWSSALREGDSLLGEINDKLLETGKIELQGWDGVFNLTPLLAEAGLTVEDWTRAVEGGEEAGAAFLQRMKDQGIGGEDLLDVVAGLAGAQSNYAEAQEQAADVIATAIPVEEDHTEALEAVEEAQEAVTDALETSISVMEEQIAAIEESIDAQYAAADAGYAVEKAQFDLHDAVTAANEVFDSGTDDMRLYREAELSVINAADGLAQAEVRKATELATANGQTLTATQRTDIYNQSLLTQASTLNGPARQAILQRITDVNGIPAEKMTEINAAIDRGDLSTAESLLNGASRTRDSAILATARQDYINYTEGQLNNLARERTVNLRPIGGVGQRNWYAKGTPYASGGDAVVGEDGPEIVNLPMGAEVIPAGKSAGMLGSGGARVVNNTFVTQNFPAGMRPSDVIDAQRKFEKRNGPQS